MFSQGTTQRDSGPLVGAVPDLLHHHRRRLHNSPNELFHTLHLWQDQRACFEDTERVATIRSLLADDTIRYSLDAVDPDGCTALFYAVQSRQHKAARLMVEAGADPFGSMPFSPLRLCFAGTKGAVGSPTLMFVKWLLAYLDHRRKREQAIACLSQLPSPLVVLCTKKHAQVLAVELLLELGVDPNAIHPGGWTALHHTARRCHPALTKLLLEHGANVDAVKDDGFTPLHVAALNGHCEVVTLLLEHGAATELLTGGGGESWLIHKTAADLADACNKPYAAITIREWQLWRSLAPCDAGDLTDCAMAN
jgi:hypothetical protein